MAIHICQNASVCALKVSGFYCTTPYLDKYHFKQQQQPHGEGTGDNYRGGQGRPRGGILVILGRRCEGGHHGDGSLKAFFSFKNNTLKKNSMNNQKYFTRMYFIY